MKQYALVGVAVALFVCFGAAFAGGVEANAPSPCFYDGTAGITCPADLTAGTNFYTTVLRGGTGTANSINLHVSAGINLFAGGSSKVTINQGSGAVMGGDVPAVVNITHAAVGNVGASGPDDLMTYTIPASGMDVTGKGFRVTAWGTCANNANAKTFTLNFGSQVILTHSCTVSVAGEVWRIQSEIIRTGASTQDWFSTYYGSTGAAGAFEFDPEIGTAAQTDTSTIVVKMQTTASTANNDIVQEGMIIEFL